MYVSKLKVMSQSLLKLIGTLCWIQNIKRNGLRMCVLEEEWALL